MNFNFKQLSHIKQNGRNHYQRIFVAVLLFFCSLSYAIADTVDNVNLTRELIYLKAEAMNMHLNACKANNAKSCSIIGNMYFKGDGVEQDFAKAIEPLTKACNQGEVRSCTFLGEMYEKGNAVEKDVGIAITIYQQACHAGDPMSCNNLTVLHEKNLDWTKKRVITVTIQPAKSSSVIE